MVHHHPGSYSMNALHADRQKKRDEPPQLPAVHPPFSHSSPTVSHNAPAQCVKDRERGERESHLTLTGMLMWAAMQLQWSIPLHSSTGAQAA